MNNIFQTPVYPPRNNNGNPPPPPAKRARIVPAFDLQNPPHAARVLFPNRTGAIMVLAHRILFP